MPDSTLPPVTISGLPQAAQATINDQIEVNQSGTSRSVTIGQIQAVPYSGGLILSGHLVGTTAFFTGEIHAATPIYPDNDTSVATTAYVTQAVMGAVGGTNPIGPAGGDLAGLYPNPTLKSGLTLNGTTTLTGNVVANNGFILIDRSGDATGAQMYLRGDTDQIASLNFQTAAGGNNRWAIFKNNTSESGSNAGSNLVIFSYDDAGASLASALTITRSTSAVTLAGGLTGTTATFSGTVTTTGGSLVTSGGNVTIDRTNDAVSAFLFVQADNGFPSGVALRTTTGNRWLISKNSVSETGSSVGSDYNLAAYDDTATAIGNYQIVTRATGYTSIGLNVTPLSRLHVKGAGQVVATIDTSTNLGNALFLQSTGGAGGDGGMILFGASAGAGAAIKGHGISNSNNTTADVVISTRRISTDATLTETARFKNDGTTVLAGALTGTTGTFSTNTTAQGMLVGHTAFVPFFTIGSANTPVAQVATTGFTGFSVQRYSSGTGGPAINMSHSKAAAAGGQTIVAAGDFLGELSFNGSDGVKFIEGASIVAQVDGTPGVDDMPTRLIFNTTADGAATPTEAMRIASNNLVTLAGALTVSGIVTSTTSALGAMRVDGPVATNRTMGATTSGSLRWIWGANADAEGGSNAGSRFVINAYSDAGAYINTPFLINRDTSIVNMAGGLTSTTATFTGIATTMSATAIGAGAATQAFIKASSTANLGIYYGNTVPTFSAAKGSLYSNTAATTTTTRLYVNTDGATTWANLTTSV